MKILLLILSCILLMVGCEVKPNTEDTNSDDTNQETDQIVSSITPEETPYEERVDDYNSDAYDDLFEKGILPKTDIVYDAESLSTLKDLSIDNLLQYVLGADGAYAEAASCELYDRFMEQPKLVLERIGVLDNSSESVLLAVISSYVASYPEENQTEFENTMYGMLENEENTDIPPVLEEMVKLYEYYKEVNEYSQDNT